MSADSRDFGFVPEENIKGSPTMIFWPAGERFGFPMQTSIPWMTFPNITIFALGFLSLFIGSLLTRRRTKLPLSFK